MNITIKFGNEVMPKHFESPPTISQVVSSAAVRAQLGYGDNVRALVNGVEQPMNAIVTDGCIVLIENKANSKATAS